MTGPPELIQGGLDVQKTFDNAAIKTQQGAQRSTHGTRHKMTKISHTLFCSFKYTIRRAMLSKKNSYRESVSLSLISFS